MKLTGRLLWSVVAAAASFAYSGGAGASYVDFTHATSSGGSWSTTIDGVTVTVSSTVGSLKVDPTLGFHVETRQEGYPGWIFSSETTGPLSVSFAVSDSPVAVAISSVGFLDYRRYFAHGCSNLPCPSVDNSLLGTYSSDEGAATAIIAPAGDSLRSGESQNRRYSGSYARGGYESDGRLDTHSFTLDIDQVGTEILFLPATLSFASGVEWAQDNVVYGVRGIEFERVLSTSVPELSGSGASSALALLVGALAVSFERRRRIADTRQ